MPGRIRFVVVLHSHQPVGNFDFVIEEAYKLSYLPYVEAFEQYPGIPLSNHYSGCLLEWLEQHHPEYLTRLAKNCGLGAEPEGGRQSGSRWEMIGGGFYEPIMTMLPERDRLGQVTRMADYLKQHFGKAPRGLWLPERVWEPALVKDLVEAGVEYLTLDDSHFRAAGLADEELVGGFITEDQGRLLRVYPASERLRYLIPFKPVAEVMTYLKSLLPEEGERVVCYADDGEKFGVWPHTYEHVYKNGWLKQFLAAVKAAQDEGWLICSTLAESCDEVEAVGRIYLPENSYREMTEWALPSTRLAAYERATGHINHDARLAQDCNIRQVMSLVKGGNWRYFKVKYPEGNRMYAKMMEVSAKVSKLSSKAKLTAKAQTHLYRGQCNCPYWHGVFGGMYLPHLRSAVYSELIKADKLCDEMTEAPEVATHTHDFDFDGDDETKLVNSHVALYLHPRRGGHLYEFDLRAIDFNVGDTFSRRFEAYHDKVARAVVGGGDNTASIHDLVLAKQPGLVELLQYDDYLRESLVDHLSSQALSVKDMLSGNPPSDPGFRAGGYELEAPGKPSKGKDSVTVELVRRGSFGEAEVQLTKKVTLRKGAGFEVEYSLMHIAGEEVEGFFGVEMNYSLLAGEAHDRYYYHEHSANAGKLATAEDFGRLSWVGLKDEWLNVALTLHSSTKAQVLVSPVKTVSQSEGGFEAVYQSSCVLLQWPVKLSSPQDGGGAFSVKLQQEIARARQ